MLFRSRYESAAPLARTRSVCANYSCTCRIIARERDPQFNRRSANDATTRTRTTESLNRQNLRPQVTKQPPTHRDRSQARGRLSVFHATLLSELYRDKDYDDATLQSLLFIVPQIEVKINTQSDIGVSGS
jgi:hypothetical protein